MKYLSKLLWICAGLLAGTLGLHLLSLDGYAAEGSSNWRPTYDLIMRWINVGIIVFVVYKYARKPFMNFLRGRKDKVAEEIQTLETRKDEMVARINQTQKDVEESDARFEDLKERIIQQGEQKNAEIIESAQNHSKMMLEDAKRRISTHFLQAKNEFRAELIDKAMDMALERLPREITPEDNDKFARLFLESSLTE
jgi:F-type H+-transporting ATPase subunit b